jgi:chromosome segregation ATPase
MTPIEALEERVEDLKDKVIEKDDEINELEKTIKELEDEIKEKDETICDLKKEIDSLKDDNSDLEDEVDDLKLELSRKKDLDHIPDRLTSNDLDTIIKMELFAEYIDKYSYFQLKERLER